MHRKFSACLASTLLGGVLVGCSSPRTAEVSELRNDVAWLADDAREGRAPETAGIAESAEYIAGRFRAVGLVPVPGVGSYFQAFALPAYPHAVSATLNVNGKPLKRNEFQFPITAQAAARTSGRLAYMGYATRVPEGGYDDFAGIDLTGRVALAMLYRPHEADGTPRWPTATPKAAWMDVKTQALAEAGANGVIFVIPPEHHENASDPLLPFGGDGLIPIFKVTGELADRLLGGDGSLDTLKAAQREIDSTGKPHSRLIDDVTIATRVDTELTEVKPAWNVVGMLPGKGPRAKEYVVVGAHYDHLGVRRDSEASSTQPVIHNGADDNASGTAAMMQLARQFARTGPHERSIVFVAFTREEQGLIGSNDFVKRHVLPGGSIIAMLNLDMVGRMKNERLYIGGGGTCAPFADILATADARSPVVLESIGLGGGNRSDHASFTASKIPSLFLFTGIHADYHRPTDEAEKINYVGLSEVVSVAADILDALCKMPKAPYVDAYDAAGANFDVQCGDVPTTRSATTQPQ